VSGNQPVAFEARQSTGLTDSEEEGEPETEARVSLSEAALAEAQAHAGEVGRKANADAAALSKAKAEDERLAAQKAEDEAAARWATPPEGETCAYLVYSRGDSGCSCVREAYDDGARLESEKGQV